MTPPRRPPPHDRKISPVIHKKSLLSSMLSCIRRRHSSHRHGTRPWWRHHRRYISLRVAVSARCRPRREQGRVHRHGLSLARCGHASSPSSRRQDHKLDGERGVSSPATHGSERRVRTLESLLVCSEASQVQAVWGVGVSPGTHTSEFVAPRKSGRRTYSLSRSTCATLTSAAASRLLLSFVSLSSSSSASSS